MQIIQLDEVDSTNSYMMREDLPVWSVVSAIKQSAGRGRSNRVWSTPDNSSISNNLAFTINLPLIPPGQIFATQLVIAFGVVNAISEYGQFKVKWPNDIVHYNSDLQKYLKVCGILLQTSFLGSSLSKLIVGVGLNVSSTPAEISTATCIKDAYGHDIERSFLLNKIICSIKDTYTGHIASSIDIPKVWGGYSANIGKSIRFHRNGGYFCGVERGVTAEGYLMVDNNGTAGGLEIIKEADIGYDFSGGYRE